MPFKVLVIMLLLLLAFLPVCQSKVNLTLDPIFDTNQLDFSLVKHITRQVRDCCYPCSRHACTALLLNLATDVKKFTADVLLFWSNHGSSFPTWALAMQIVGSFTPNSAAVERVFSLLKLMFGDMQMSALADTIQAALMLKYNERKVG